MKEKNLEQKLEGIIGFFNSRNSEKRVEKSKKNVDEIRDYSIDPEIAKKRYTEYKIEIFKKLSKLFVDGDIHSRDELISKINGWAGNYCRDLRKSKDYDHSSYIRGLVDLGLLKRNKGDSLFEGCAKKVSYEAPKKLEKSAQEDDLIIVKRMSGSPYNKHKTKILKELSGGFSPGTVYSRDDAILLIKMLADDYDPNLLNQNGYDYMHLLRGLIDIGHLNRNKTGTKYCKGTPRDE